MNVTVKIPGGKTIVLFIEAWESITNIKTRLEDPAGIPVDDQKLIFAGKAIENGRTLADYNIQAESTLHLVRRRRRREPVT